MNLILCGPPGSGKTTVGRIVAGRLGREFVDGDGWIEARWGRPVASYFDAEEETLFRAREAQACRTWAAGEGLVIAPGGGALLEPHSRAALEGTGVVICLMAGRETLLKRLDHGPRRPLLEGDAAARLGALLGEREPLHRSFALQVNTDRRAVESVAEEVIMHYRAADGVVRFELGECSAFLGRGLCARLPELFESKSLRPPFVVIADANVGPLHGAAACRALSAPLIEFPAGEAHKTLETVRDLYAACLAHGLERGGTILALGGGVVGDTAGFVAATLMRGVRWANLPTTVLAMADASLGGKVGVDLPEGKNLVGAFHPPALVVADFDLLATLPEAEVRSGLAEVIKAAVIGDPDLFDRLDGLTIDGAGNESPGIPASRRLAEATANSMVRPTIELEAAVARGAAVKVGIVNADPFERGERARLNFGHTIGHGLEAASGYALRHGEAVSIGMVAESALAEALGLAEAGLARRIAAGLRRAGLPTSAPGLKPAAIRAAMRLDKKKMGGRLRFALPREMGDVAWGVEVSEDVLGHSLERINRDEP